MLWIACKFFIAITILTGCLYPLLITEIATLTMPDQAYGSLVYEQEKLRGSALIGQSFTQPQYFWPRPSITDYHPLPSIASNWGPTSQVLKKMVQERAEKWKKEASHSLDSIPTELLYASCCNFDPHISPEAAYYQSDRVAKSRSLNREETARLNMIIEEHTESAMEIFGPPCVNVFLLNKRIDEEFNSRKKL